MFTFLLVDADGAVRARCHDCFAMPSETFTHRPAGYIAPAPGQLGTHLTLCNGQGKLLTAISTPRAGPAGFAQLIDTLVGAGSIPAWGTR